MTDYKHYHTLTELYQQKYQKKVAKIALNAGFTCPNRDGKKGFGGCIYCSKLGSGDTAGDIHLSLDKQFHQISDVIEQKWPNSYYIPYLQSFSNTYAPLEKLKQIYEKIIQIEPQKTVGFAIATRPDCFTDELYAYLEELNQRIPLSIELGLQTANPKTATRINRCSTNEEFIQCVKELNKRHIEVVVHIINGLPGETKEDMLHTIDFINSLDIQGIKFHCLLILKDTPLYQEYLNHPFHLLTLEEYVDIVAEQIAKLKPTMVIHRLSADAPKDQLYLPKWPLKKLVVMNEIDKLLNKNHLYQGDHFK